MNRNIEINRGGENPIGQSGIGYIVIPDETMRDQYIENCYRTQTVTINGGYGYGYISQVKILPDVLQKISFPLEKDGRGSQVLWLRENFSNRPIVIGILSEEGLTNLLSANQSRYVQEINDKIVEIFQDANSATLNINVVGNKDFPSKINIKVTSGSEDSEISLVSDGKVSVDANSINLTSYKDINASLKTSDGDDIFNINGNAEGISFSDENGNSISINKDNINITPAKKINFNTGKEPMVLGRTLVDILKEILQGIQNITVTTSSGTSSVPLNISTFSSISQKLENILSEIANLD